MWGVHDSMGWWMIFGGIWMVLFWGLIIWFLAWAITRVGRTDSGSSARSPLDIARERYARGEITKEEFDRLRRDLA